MFRYYVFVCVFVIPQVTGRAGRSGFPRSSAAASLNLQTTIRRCMCMCICMHCVYVCKTFAFTVCSFKLVCDFARDRATCACGRWCRNATLPDVQISQPFFFHDCFGFFTSNVLFFLQLIATIAMLASSNPAIN